MLDTIDIIESKTRESQTPRKRIPMRLDLWQSSISGCEDWTRKWKRLKLPQPHQMILPCTKRTSTIIFKRRLAFRRIVHRTLIV